MYGDDISSPFYFISVSSNGRTTVSKTVYLGSNPSTGAIWFLGEVVGRNPTNLRGISKYCPVAQLVRATVC